MPSSGPGCSRACLSARASARSMRRAGPSTPIRSWARRLARQRRRPRRPRGAHRGRGADRHAEHPDAGSHDLTRPPGGSRSAGSSTGACAWRSSAWPLRTDPTPGTSAGATSSSRWARGGRAAAGGPPGAQQGAPGRRSGGRPVPAGARSSRTPIRRPRRGLAVPLEGSPALRRRACDRVPPVRHRLRGTQTAGPVRHAVRGLPKHGLAVDPASARDQALIPRRIAIVPRTRLAAAVPSSTKRSRQYPSSDW